MTILANGTIFHEAMKLLRTIILLLTIPCLNTFGFSKEKTTVYTVNEGLSQHSVTCIAQDSKNMLWIGTFDGLNRFDGIEFKRYRHIPGDSTSIISNRVISICHDEKEGLWVLFANNHLGKHLGNGKFRNYKISDSVSDLGNWIRAMQIIDGRVIITGNRQKVMTFPIPGKDTDTNETLLDELIRSTQGNGDQILSIDKMDKRIWVSSTEGVYCLTQNNIFRIPCDYTDHYLKCFDDGHLVFWKDRKVIICRTSNENLENPAISNIAELPLESPVNTVCYGHNNDLWIATIKGLYKYYNMQLTYYPPSSRIRTVFCDNMGVIWSGGGTGMLSINPYSQPIYNYKFKKDNSSIYNHVNNLCSSADGKELWVGTRHTGLSHMEIVGSQSSTPRFVQKALYFENTNITLAFPISKDSILIGMDKHLKMLIRASGGFRQVDLASDPKWEHPFKAIRSGDHILFSSGPKLYRLGLHKNNMKVSEASELNSRLQLQSIITTMVNDPMTDDIWIGTRGEGVYRINPGSAEIEHLSKLVRSPLKSNYIWHLMFDRKGNMWIGTDTGLHFLDCNTETSSMRVISVNEGLVNDKIESIEEDGTGLIWAGTSQGMICYDPDLYTIKTYGYEDGFQTNNFTSTSTTLPDGYLVFGSINGFCYFNPERFMNTSLAPSINIENIVIGGIPVDESRWSKIKVKDKENNIRVDLCSYYSPNPQKIRHRFSINESEWKVTADKTLYLTDMKPGRYTMSVQSFTDMDVTSDAITIEFRILRPMLLSIVAMIIYVLIAGIIVMVIIKATIHRNYIAHKLNVEEELRKVEKSMAEEKLSFYTNMAHEIKTPLTLILGRTYDIEQCDEASPYIVRKARLIEENANIIRELAEQILEFKRAISGKLKLNLYDTDIMPEIRKIVENYKDYADKRGIILELESSSESIIKHIDIQKIIRILYNLISNAIKFSDSGDKVLIKIVDKKKSLSITVSDTGSGISEEDMPHIFKRFYKAGQAGGSGIGLAFTKSLVELMGGSITASSKVGEGTTFVVNIPIREASEPQTIESMTVEDTTVPETISTVPEILLIEDNIELNDYITEVLSVRFKVHTAYNASEATDILHKKKIDLILSDVMMAGMDGITLVKKIKSIKSHAHIPIVILSAKSDPDDQLTGLNTGAVDYITKPFNPHILLVKVQNILTQYYLSKENFKEGDLSHSESIRNFNRDEAFINKAREIIYQKLSDETFGVNYLSEEMGISRVHLTREFHRIINQSPSVFIKRIRLNHARHLLESGNTSIKEVLWEIGIRSHSGFTKAFKEEFGFLPSRFTKE